MRVDHLAEVLCIEPLHQLLVEVVYFFAYNVVVGDIAVEGDSRTLHQISGARPRSVFHLNCAEGHLTIGGSGQLSFDEFVGLIVHLPEQPVELPL